MDRPDPGLIRWSPNASLELFLHINLQHRVVQVYEPTGHAQRGKFEFRKRSKNDDFPTLTTYDWSPTIPGLVAVGTPTGVVNLLRVDDNSNAYLELNLKMSRTCQAVAFSTSNKLAVGLDRVRSDRCLYIWDVNRLSSMESGTAGFPKDMAPFTEPLDLREPSVSVSSVRFFEDNPNTLVVGIKGQGLRLHDLRDPSPQASFQTKCNNNLAIDYADPNYFASSALDQPGVMIWDRRAGLRELASPSYLDAHDVDELPWGGALRLDQAVESEADQGGLGDNKNSVIRSLRYCRDHRGMLAVLSRTGQLKVFDTQKEISHPDMEAEGSPELLHVRRSNEMDNYYSDANRKNDRIVSFDWITMGSPVLRPRALVLRANGSFDILEKPSFTTTYPYKLVPWTAPYRGLEEGTSYHGLMRFEASQAADLLGPLVVEDALSDISVFGPNKDGIDTIVEKSLQSQAQGVEVIVDDQANKAQLPDSFSEAATIAEKLQILRSYSKQHIAKKSKKKPHHGQPPDANDIADSMASLTTTQTSPPTSRELHELLLNSTLTTKGFPNEAQAVIDHIMLLRAKEKYLFDCKMNRRVVSDDPWLRDVWTWIAGAEEAVADEGMTSHPLDLGYMGVASIWMNDLGAKSSARLSDPGTSNPDVSVWERSINAICKKRGVPRFDGVDTKKPHHRQLCLDICNWGRSASPDMVEFEQMPVSERTSTYHTMATAHALFRGDSKQAVQILKTASTEHPELLFVSLALQLIGKGDDLAKEHLDFDETVASKTDPYLRAISSLIATGDWATIANQKSLPLRERVFVAVRNFDDQQLTRWLTEAVAEAVETGDVEGIVLTGITDRMVDILAKYVEKFHDVQTATLIMSFCAPRAIDDYRCSAWRNGYRAYLQRHRAFLQRAKFEVESTKRSKSDGRPTIKPPFRQIALRCIYCDAETGLAGPGQFLPGGAADKDNQLPSKLARAGVSCPNCRRQLPRCVVCLEVVGMPRSDKPEASTDPETRLAARFPTFCLKCEHVLHLDHARQWFARHVECPVPECRCRCNFRANPELNYH